MTIEKQNETDNRISLKTKTVNVLLESAKSELSRLQENPDVKRALLLQETLKNMQPTVVEESISQRDNERGADINTRIMRTKTQINEDRASILALVEEYSPISIQDLYEFYRPEEPRADHLYKAMYSDITLHKEKGLINKAKNILTFIKQKQPASAN